MFRAPALVQQRLFFVAVIALLWLQWATLHRAELAIWPVLIFAAGAVLSLHALAGTFGAHKNAQHIKSWLLPCLGLVSAALSVMGNGLEDALKSGTIALLFAATFLARAFGLRAAALFSVLPVASWFWVHQAQFSYFALALYLSTYALLIGIGRPRQLLDEVVNLRRQNRQLQARLADLETSFEGEIEQQTHSLKEANTQLGQQIALRKTISDALVKSQTRLTQAIDASKLGLIDWDVKNGEFYQSSFHDIFGDKEQSSEQIIQTLKEVIHADDYSLVRDTLNTCLRGELASYQLQYRVAQQDGWLWIEECGKVVDQAGDGRADRILGTRRNIHTEMQRDEQVRLAKYVFDHSPEGVFVLDLNGEFRSANPAYSRFIGLDAGDLVGRNIASLSDTPKREQVFDNIFKAARQQGYWQGELLEKRVHGDYFPQRTQVNAITDDNGNVKYFAGMVSDLSDSKATDEQLFYLLNYDDLTKLANRVQFRDQLHRALVRYKDQQKGFALVLLDVDRFKQFNDSFGHEASDQLLVEIAERLSARVQKVDILARVGSNEFACIVECSPTFDVQKFAQRLFEVVTHEPYQISGDSVVLSCSVGIAQVPNDAQDIETLRGYGALAVQKAKFHGGNQIQTFEPSLKSFSKRRLEVEHELRQALRNDELEVFYQPKYDLKLGKISSYEALIRWIHPTQGIVSPEEFVNIAEENGLINDLGAFVLSRACEQTQAWLAQGYEGLQVSVNLSARQLKQDDFRTLLAETIQDSGLPAECLELELTESMIMADRIAITELLSQLREQGIKVSVDDFGTGYSSLSYLKELPVDTLKIDRAFVDGMESSSEQQAIVKAIIVLGSSLNLHVVAEGVENEAQFALLQGYGCDQIQGYHVSKPLTADQMEQLLAEQSAELLDT